ncbi:Fe-S cluster assembly ATPase SufC [Bifidobacterium callitrichos]|uniref:Fe-S cluster assembly ATPase SufC n=1 Tax=Bifidobacterium callitrichos TaxID=762209 RepID=A0A5M9ZDS0_9BIFI|nr:Fe-S cluster assembly ATPase SufC [Bifidobacterium callitrichos]KAA8817178.1 Fe-S cluster assembly ATPase SufC [Bifidobacterium callitrichos]
MAGQHTLEIKDLYASVETKEGRKQILKGVNLTVHSGETHAIMGPNGSGKSTLAYTLAGHPKYEVDSGEALLDGVDILKQTPDLRAKEGLFLAMQYPVEVPGVSMTNFLRTAKTEIDGQAPAIRTWAKELGEAMKRLRMDPKFASRSVNDGFSGGEKKRAEVLQLELLKPKFAIMDETDSGLDVDALRIVSEGVNRAKENTDLGILMVTHYTRILKYIKPDIVHVFADGHFVKTGGPELADYLEEHGYDEYLPEGADSESALA